MDSLKNFEWYRDSAGYRLACLPERSRDAFWIKDAKRGWSDEQNVDRSVKLRISTSEYKGEIRVPKRGIYVSGHRQWLNTKKADEISHLEIVRPFETGELVSLNLLQSAGSPKGWLDFTNKFGMIGSEPLQEHWHVSGSDPRLFIGQVEHEGVWHRLTNLLSRIYSDYPAIEKRDSKYLSTIIKWESDDVVREDRGHKIGRAKVIPAIAMRGKYSRNVSYFERMSRPDVLTPAAFALRDHINRYMEKALSLELAFDSKTLKFSSTLRYGSLGAALIAEAVEFMAGHFEARQCAVCGSWFRMGANQMRRDRIFCSSACKMRDYRTRKNAKAKTNRSAV